MELHVLQSLDWNVNLVTCVQFFGEWYEYCSIHSPAVRQLGLDLLCLMMSDIKLYALPMEEKAMSALMCSLLCHRIDFNTHRLLQIGRVNSDLVQDAVVGLGAFLTCKIPFLFLK
jgi:hypothetical protein